MEPHTTCPDPRSAAQVDTYTQAARRGLFSTDTLPPAVAAELARYEQAILHLRAASRSLQWPYYTDPGFASDQHRYCAESIGEIVQTVQTLREHQRQAFGADTPP
ncbi:MAG: hypothetical protein ABF636_12265 [Acetobacter sp.]